MSQKIVNPSLVRGVISTFKHNFSTINRKVYRETYILYSRPQYTQQACAPINLCYKSKNHFFGSKKTEEKAAETEDQKTETKKEEEKPKAETKAEAEKPKEAPKATKIPDTIEGLVESLPAEHKKRVLELYKKLEADNAKNSKTIKELNDKVSGLESHNNDQKTKMIALRDRLKEEIDERELARVRLEKEVENTKVFAITKFAKELLEIPDNLERALNVAKDLEGKGDQLYEGVKATRSILLNILDKHGIKQINPVGEKFDPNQHEALFDYPDPKGTPGHVGHVLTVGYKIQERILRPAKVGVVKDNN